MGRDDDDVGRCVDAKSYLTDKYKNDIFFATDFIVLSQLVHSLTKNDASVGEGRGFHCRFSNWTRL